MDELEPILIIGITIGILAMSFFLVAKQFHWKLRPLHLSMFLITAALLCAMVYDGWLGAKEVAYTEFEKQQTRAKANETEQ